MGFFYICRMEKIINTKKMNTIFDDKGNFLKIKNDKIIMKKPFMLSYHHLKNIMYFCFRFFLIIRINLFIELKNKIKNINFFYYPLLISFLPLSLFLPKFMYYIFLKKSINMYNIYKDTFGYLYYDWQFLYNSLNKEGYYPKNNSHIKIFIKNNKFYISDGNHRVYLLKKMYPKGKDIEVML